MAKTLHSRHNKIFLKMLRELRESRGLRQSDLAALLGRSQATVSNVERGERRLDVIELLDWLAAMDEEFMNFTARLNEKLQPLMGAQLKGVSKRRRPGAAKTLGQLLKAVTDPSK